MGCTSPSMWCWRRWGSMSGATSTCWDCAEVRPRMLAVRALLADLVERGLDTNRSLLIVIDGAKALHKAVIEVFGARGLIQRCREHKKRNVTDGRYPSGCVPQSAAR